MQASGRRADCVVPRGCLSALVGRALVLAELVLAWLPRAISSRQAEQLAGFESLGRI